MKLQPPVKGIFFDLGWTLIAPRSGDWMLSPFGEKVFQKEKLDALPQDRVKAARKAGMDFLDTHHLLETVEEEYALFHQYYAMLAEALPELGVSAAAVKEVARDHVYNTENSYAFADAVPTLEALKGGYKLGVLSDTWPSIIPKLRAYGLYDFFDCFTFSYALGVYKPHPKMYEDALEKMALPPRQTVFVDDFTGNLEGARAAGIQPVLIGAKPQPDEAGDMPKIPSVSGLLALLP